MGVSALEKSEFTLGADSIFRPSLLVNKIRNVTLEICFLGVLDLTLCAIIFQIVSCTFSDWFNRERSTNWLNLLS